MTRAPSLRILSLVALCFVLAVGTAHGQRGPGRGPGGPGGRPGGFGRGPGGPGGFGGPVGLLRSETVRQDVGITEDEAQKLREIAEQTMRGVMEQFRGLRDLSEQERRERSQQLREKAQERMKELEKKIADVIGGEKFKRLKQIELQVQGTGALRRPEVAEFLGLTDEQKSKLTELGQQNRQQMRGIFEGVREMPPEEREGLREKIQKIRQELEKNSMAVLSDEQKQKLGEMMGEPFSLDKLREEMQRGGRFGGRRPQGGRDARGRGDQGRGDRPGGGDRRQRAR